MKETNHQGAEKAIAQSITPVLIDLHASWCTHCVKTRPHLERISAERQGAMEILGIDTDEEPDAFTMFKVKTLPAIILFSNGVEVARRGSGDYDELVAWLAENGI